MSSPKTTKLPPDERAIDLATKEGREAAREPYATAIIPIKYHTKKELGDAWYTGFMSEIKETAR